MTNHDTQRADRARMMEREARALGDEALEQARVQARTEADDLARRLADARAWSHTLDAEHYRRSVQRRVG